MSETQKQFPLSGSKIIKKTLSNSIAWTTFLFIVWGCANLIIYSFNSQVSSQITPILFIYFPIFIISIILITYLYQRWYIKTYFYDFTPDYIVIKKGPLTPREITIPYERIQDVYMDQDLMDRIFGLFDVHLSSATISSGMEAHIDGLNETAAKGLREALLKTVSSKISGNKITVV